MPSPPARGGRHPSCPPSSVEFLPRAALRVEEKNSTRTGHPEIGQAGFHVLVAFHGAAIISGPEKTYFVKNLPDDHEISRAYEVVPGRCQQGMLWSYKVDSE